MPSSQGPNNPSAAASIGPGNKAWSNLSNVFVSDNLTANAGTLLPFQVTEILRSTGFGFTIPPLSLITGVKVEVARYASGDIEDSAVNLVLNGSPVGDDKAGGPWPSPPGNYKSYGGDSELWGSSLTPEDINDETFGVELCAENTSAFVSATAYVDHVRITVSYLPPETHADTDTGEGGESQIVVKDGVPSFWAFDMGTVGESTALSKNMISEDAGTGAVAAALDKELAPGDAGTGGESATIEEYISSGRARERDRAEPVYLVEIALCNSGPTLHFSDRNLEVLGIRYTDYLEDLSGLGEELRRADSGGLNADITLKFRNERFESCNYLIELGETYPFEGAEVTVKEMYLDCSGAPSLPEILFKGVLDEPREIDLMGFTCSVSSMMHAAERRWKQAVVDKATYPDAREDVGRIIPVVYGGPFRIPALRTRWGWKTTLIGSITASSSSVEVSDASGLPSSGYGFIDGEQVAFTKSGNTLNMTRGQGGTQAAPHRSGAVFWQKLSEYDSVLADHVLHSVGDIYAEIDGLLHRVTSGVSALYIGGRHILRATSQVRVAPAEDQMGVNDSIGVYNPQHNHSYTRNTNQFSTNQPIVRAPDSGCSDLYKTKNGYINFPSTSGKLSANYTVEYEITFPCTYVPNDCEVTIGGVTVYKRQSGSTTVNKVSPLKFSQGQPTDSVTVHVSMTPPVGTPMAIQCNILSAERTCDVTDNSVNETQQTTKTGAATKSGEVVVATRTVERFHSMVSGYKDPDGSYGGAGTLIQRPDHVIKHFLVHRVGFVLGEVDDDSFTDSGDNYASAISDGYRFAFGIDRKVSPSEFLKQLASECRSTLDYSRGIWRLFWLPDAAPDAQKVIRKEDLAGEFATFVFHRTPMEDIANELASRFEQNYCRLGNESEWDGSAAAEDAPSKSKYGVYPMESDFYAVRLQAMADHVLDHMLKQRRSPLLFVEFPVFWDHFDLHAGDTVEIENPLFDRRKFYIEGIRRVDRFRAVIKAVEWY